MLRIEVQSGFITNSSSTIYTMVIFGANLNDFNKWLDEMIAKSDEELEKYNFDSSEGVEDFRESLEYIRKEQSWSRSDSKIASLNIDCISFGGGGYDPETEFYQEMEALELFVKDKKLDHLCNSYDG